MSYKARQPIAPQYATTLGPFFSTRTVYHNRLSDAKQTLAFGGNRVGSIWEWSGNQYVELYRKAEAADPPPWIEGLTNRCSSILKYQEHEGPVFHCTLGAGHPGKIHRSIAANATWS